jgi:hypothetical protein
MAGGCCDAIAARLAMSALERSEHDPKEWAPVLGKDHAQASNLERDDFPSSHHLALAVEKCGAAR